MMRKSLLKRGLLATAFVAAFAFATVGTNSEASARHCHRGGSYYSGHHSGGHYGGGHYGGSHRVHSSYYSPRTVYYSRGGHYGHGHGGHHGNHYYGGHSGHHGYGGYHGGRSGVSVSFGF